MKIVLILGILCSTLTMNAQQSLNGIWNTGKENTKIEISEVDGVLEGKIFSSDNPNVKIGKVLLKDIKSVKGEWQGKLFAAKKEKWMDTVIKENGNQLLITVKAGIMRKTLEWTKE
ncbi:MAG: hypothetical protein AAF502_15065 [Bacteroidota bacterium]